MRTLFRQFILFNQKLGNIFDSWFAEKYRIDGNSFFQKEFVPRYIRSGLKIYDIGGGKHPHVEVGAKRKLALDITLLDIDQSELDRAPEHSYDHKLSADITSYRGRADADLIICQAVLEHVEHLDSALSGISSILKPGGIALIFVPSRNAIYARLNLLLPQEWKRKLLYLVYPATADFQGFPSFYNQCTPRGFRRLAGQYGLSIDEVSFHYISSYFFFLFPIYLLHRIWIFVFHACAGEDAAETFCIALKKLS